jgi:hypothetical protein
MFSVSRILLDVFAYHRLETTGLDCLSITKTKRIGTLSSDARGGSLLSCGLLTVRVCALNDKVAREKSPGEEVVVI